MKKKIGISYTETNLPNYLSWFTEDDLNRGFELVQLSFKENNTEDFIDCSGFILTGGIDIDPAMYNGDPVYPNKPRSFRRDRDEFEKLIFQYSQKHRRPVLGICRGLQLVNVLQGGKLIQDLGPLNNIHTSKTDIDKQHTVNAEENTLLAEITGITTGHVNSAHHQAVPPDAVGDSLMVNAWSEDKSIIEGLEFKDKRNKGFMLCVQWHPERITDKERNPFSLNLKNRFLEEASKIQL